MKHPVKLIYGYDPLCGWCYGLIPAMRNFSNIHPNVSIEVLPGGLFSGDRARPYSMLVDHIRSAEIHLEQATGRKPSELFHRMIKQENCPVAISDPPSHAVLQMNSLAPERALEFAHLLQEVHYQNGEDLNMANTYNRLCDKHGFPDLDTDAIVNATSDDPLIAQSYRKASKLGVNSFPTILVADQNNKIAGTI